MAFGEFCLKCPQHLELQTRKKHTFIHTQTKKYTDVDTVTQTCFLFFVGHSAIPVSKTVFITASVICCLPVISCCLNRKPALPSVLPHPSAKGQ